MTKTQANKPGFVLAPREPTEAMLDAAVEKLADDIEGGMSDREFIKAAYRRLLASAHLVPSPAYGGVKEAGWISWTGGECPVPDCTEGLLRVEDGEVIYSTKLGTFNFAHDASGPYPGRRIVAYRVLSPVAVEEADAEAEHTVDGIGMRGAAAISAQRLKRVHEVNTADASEELFLIRKRGAYYRPNEQGYTSSIAEAGRYSREDAERITHPNGSDGPRDGMDYVPAPSTPSPQIGEAGAGPAGEAVGLPWRVEASIYKHMEAEIVGENGGIAQVWKGPKAWEIANFIASSANASLAHPVEEPGEVERQRGWIYFNPDAGTEWAEHHPVESGEVHDAEDIRPGTSVELLRQLLPAWKDLAAETSRRETAEAALAETRESLEKVEAERDALAKVNRGCRWYWPAEDTEASVDSAQDAYEQACGWERYDGTVAEIARGGIVETTWCAALPAADDSDRDDDFWIEEATEAEAQAKIDAERQRRAALTGDAQEGGK